MKYISYLNNLGIVNALGLGKQAVISHLFKAQPKTMTHYRGLLDGRTTWVAAVKEKLVTLPDSLAKYHCRNNQLIATAYQEIATNVETLKERYGKSRIGIVLGTSTSGIATGEIAVKYQQQHGSFPKHFAYTQQEIGNCADFLASYADITGVHYTVSTACSSSGKAFSTASRLLEADICDAVIVGGSDSLCQMTLNGFNSLELISNEICNPFSQNRKGLNIGEGAALFILTKEPAEIKLTGIGESSDGYHISTPDPEAKGAILAIEQALISSGHKPDDIGYINLHGTATNKNDAMESHAIYSIFKNNTSCSSIKSLLGHSLGAAAAQELGICWLLLSNKYNAAKLLPAQIWDKIYDPSMPEIHITSANEKFSKPVMMSNSFAFGGSNVSLIIEKG